MSLIAMQSNTLLERVVLEVFGGCNYKCTMCPQTVGRGKDFVKLMPLDMFEDILDQITPKYGTPVINLEGSGEPTLVSNLPLYIEACTRRNLKSNIFCNGSNLNGAFMQDVVAAGLSLVRFSCIGYNKELYKKWMGVDNFDLVLDNAREMQAHISKVAATCNVSSYHLIIDKANSNYEVEQYNRNFINPVKSIGYIWLMHNWSGNYNPIYIRNSNNRKTCGRPLAPELTIRAGGNGKLGAVTPCCQTMGTPNEAKSVLGHFQDQTFEEIYFGEEYNKLRELHHLGKFDEIDYCKNCDFLYDTPEVLVWSNDKTAKVHNMLGTTLNLRDYQSLHNENS